MKTLILSFLTVLLSGQTYAQSDIIGRWRINTLVGLTEVNEYRLTRSDEFHIYGNSIVFDFYDQRFISHYSATCGNDCFTSNQGSYKLIDQNHISFFLKQVDIYGDCEMQLHHPNKELGVFFIVRDSIGIRLIRSEQNAEQNQQNKVYSDKIDAFDQETSSIHNLYFIETKPTQATTNFDIVKDCYSDNKNFDPSALKILFHKTIRGEYYRIILFEYKGEQQFAFYNLHHKSIGIYYPGSLPEK